jgi:hypothetical protein
MTPATASLHYPSAGHPGLAPLSPRRPRTLMRGRGWSLIRPLKRRSSDPFYAVAGNPPSITPPGPSLSKVAAQSNPHNDALLASPRAFVLRRLSNAGPQHGFTTLITGRHPKPFT